MPAGGGEAKRLGSDLSRMAGLTNRRLEPRAQRLARDLPADSDRLAKLREPASTAQSQLKVALAQLREMSTLAYDPHYLPTLIAVGRAYVAVSGLDPVTGTTVNPEYTGLESELAADGARLDQSTGEAAKLSADVKRLSAQLTRARRRARRLEGGRAER